jgi:hypothetical protein
VDLGSGMRLWRFFSEFAEKSIERFGASDIHTATSTCIAIQLDGVEILSYRSWAPWALVVQSGAAIENNPVNGNQLEINGNQRNISPVTRVDPLIQSILVNAQYIFGDSRRNSHRLRQEEEGCL